MNNNKGGSFRVKRNPFTQVSNAALRDSNLSLKSKGLYSLIQSYITIPNFTLYKGHLMSLCKEKDKAFNSAWKELKDNGYLKQYRIPKGENDTFVYEYDLLDIADVTTPSLTNLSKNGEEIRDNHNPVENLEHENLEYENSEHFPTKNGSIETKKPENGISHTPPLVPYAESTTCERHPVRGGGGINNTDRNYIDENNIKREEYSLTYMNSSHKSLSDGKKGLSTGDLSTICGKDETADNESCQQELSSKVKVSSEIKKEPLKPTPVKNGLKSSLRSTQSSKDDYTTYKEIIQENIEYTYFLKNRSSSEIKLVDELVNCMLDVICTKGDTVRINGKEKNRNMVKSQYLKINSMDIDHILDRYKNQHHKITHIHSYLKTMLYTVKQESGHYYTNAVRADGVVW